MDHGSDPLAGFGPANLPLTLELLVYYVNTLNRKSKTTDQGVCSKFPHV